MRSPLERTHTTRPVRRALMALGTAVSLGVGLVVGLAVPGAAVTAGTATTGRASVTSGGAQVGQEVDPTVLLDTEGRFVLFSGVGAYTARDTNGTKDVYVRDRLAGTTVRVSVTDGEQQITGDSTLCGASADARYVAFRSDGANLPGAGKGHVFLRDRIAGTTKIASVAGDGTPSAINTSSGVAGGACDVSLTGRFVVFSSAGSNLVAGDTNGEVDVFRHDFVLAQTQRVSVRSNGTQLEDGLSFEPQMTDDGSVVVYTSFAPGYVGDDNGAADVFRRPMVSAGSYAVSLASGDAANGESTQPAIAGDGSVIAYASTATNLIDPGEEQDASSQSDVYTKVPGEAWSELVSVTSTEAQANGASFRPAVSTDGRYVGFTSLATNLWLFDGNGVSDAFVRDRTLGQTFLTSRRWTGLASGDGTTADRPAISGDGQVHAFATQAGNLGRGDANGKRDVYVRDMSVDHTPFPSFGAHVTQQFADFAGRAPTPAELQEWSERLTADEISPDAAIDEMAQSAPWATHRAPVTRLYWAFFLRAPDTSGLQHWVDRRTEGRSLGWIAERFALSPEFKTTYGALTDAQFVTLVYQNVLERDPDAAGLAYWTAQLAAETRTRGTMMVGFSESAEGRTFLAPQVGVALVHLGMFGTIPPKAVFAGHLASIEGGNPIELLIRSWRLSAAYAARVGA